MKTSSKTPRNAPWQPQRDLVGEGVGQGGRRLGKSSCSIYTFAFTTTGRALAFCALRNIKDSSQNSVYFELGLPLSLAPSPFGGWGWLST